MTQPISAEQPAWIKERKALEAKLAQIEPLVEHSKELTQRWWEMEAKLAAAEERERKLRECVDLAVKALEESNEIFCRVPVDSIVACDVRMQAAEDRAVVARIRDVLGEGQTQTNRETP